MEDIDHSVETVHNQSKEIESRHTAEVKKELTDLKERLELTEKIAEWSYTTEVKKEVMDLKEQLELTEERMQIRSLSEKDLDEAKPRFKECMMAWIEYLTIMRQKHFKSCCVDLHEPVDCTDKKQNKVMKAVFNFGVKYLDDDVELGEEARTIILRVHMEKLRTRLTEYELSAEEIEKKCSKEGRELDELLEEWVEELYGWRPNPNSPNPSSDSEGELNE